MNVLLGMVRDLARQVGKPAAGFAWGACPIQVSTIRGCMLIEGGADEPQDCGHGLQQALLRSGGGRRLPADTYMSSAFLVRIDQKVHCPWHTEKEDMRTGSRNMAVRSALLGCICRLLLKELSLTA